MTTVRELGERAKRLARRTNAAAFNAGYEDAHPSDAWTRQEKTAAVSKSTLAECEAAIDALVSAAERAVPKGEPVAHQPYNWGATGMRISPRQHFGVAQYYKADDVDRAAPPQSAENPWRDAIDDALVINCIDCIKPGETPREALARLIQWETQIALDPLVSSEAQALINKGRESQSAAVEALRAACRVLDAGDAIPPASPEAKMLRAALAQQEKPE